MSVRRTKAPVGSEARVIDRDRNAALVAALELRLAIASEQFDTGPFVAREGVEWDEQTRPSEWSEEAAALGLEPGRTLLTAQRLAARRSLDDFDGGGPERPAGLDGPEGQQSSAGTHIEVNARAIPNGRFCCCDSCSSDGPHEPACGVHDEPRGVCSCSRIERRSWQRLVTKDGRSPVALT